MLRLGKFSFVFMTLLCGQTLAQTSGMVRIGVMNDMAGVYSDDQGPGSVLAAQHSPQPSAIAFGRMSA